MTNVAQLPVPAKSLFARFAERYTIDEDKLMTTLKATAFKQRDNKEVSNEQMTALLIVADQYGLNPFTKEIYAYPDKQNGIVPVVGVDGWSRIINEHKMLDGIEFRYSDKMTTQAGAKPCPDWCEVIITRKDRAKPIVVREYLDEVFRQLDYATPWKTHTKRMLRHKTLIQGARIAFGFGGIYDDDEAERILDAHAIEGHVIDRQYAEVEQPKLTDSAATAATPANPQTGAGGGGADQSDVPHKPMIEGQKKMLKARLANAKLTPLDLEAHFGKKLDSTDAPPTGYAFSDYAVLEKWISEHAKA